MIPACHLRRRRFLVGAAGVMLPPPSAAARATPADVAAAIAAVTKGATPRPGKVKLDMPAMVENGNAVSLTVSVDAPVQASSAGEAAAATAAARVVGIDVFAEGNPLPNVARFRFGPRAGLPRVTTRMRLATSQTVVAVAELSDGTFWTDSVDLIVTLAACVE